MVEFSLGSMRNSIETQSKLNRIGRIETLYPRKRTVPRSFRNQDHLIGPFKQLATDNATDVPYAK